MDDITVTADFSSWPMNNLEQVGEDRCGNVFLKIRGNWYTLPDLLEKEKQLMAEIKAYVDKQRG